MSIFDSSHPSPFSQILKNHTENLAELKNKPKLFTGLFVVKTASGRFKAQNITLIDNKLLFVPVFSLFYHVLHLKEGFQHKKRDKIS